MKIGKSLKNIRKERKMTLKELSGKSGVAIATLSRMEHDIMTGTLESHINICKALEISLSDFYKSLESGGKDLRTMGTKPQKTVKNSSEASLELLTTGLTAKMMMPVLINLRKRSKTTQAKADRKTEKFIYVLEGTLEINIDNELLKLKKGDCLYFDATEKHTLYNKTDKETTLLAVSSPPGI